MNLEKNVWEQRRDFGGPWGYGFGVFDAETDEEIARGWRQTEEEANRAADRIIADKKTEFTTLDE